MENDPTHQIEWDSLHNLYYNQPGGTSTKNMIHWLQTLGSEGVKYFDYGPVKNMLVYNSTEPKEYNLEILKNMTIDTFITTTSGDPYCLKEDFNLMKNTFTKAKLYIQDVGNYNHLDYLWGKNAHIDIYIHILNFLQDH